MNPIGSSVVRVVLSLWMAAAGAVAFAQPYPSRAIQIVVPFAPGGSIDVTYRLISPKLSELLGQQVVVVNRPGGGTTIGMGSVAKSAPDGYTFGAASLAFAAQGPFLGGKLPFDPERDFVPVTLIAGSPLVVLVHPGVPARTMRELIDHAKSKPGVLNYGSVGIASSGHVVSALIESVTGIRMVHVPFTTGPLPALIAGTIQVQLSPIPTALPFVRAGKAIPLAVTSLRQIPTLPGVPTMAEAGIPDFEAGEWTGLLAPAGTPRAVIERMRADIVATLADASIAEKLAGLGSFAVGSTGEEFAAHLRREFTRWTKIGEEIVAAEAKHQAR